MTVLLLILAFVGWALAAFCCALWLGERGRRRDLAFLTGQVAERGRAVVHSPPVPEERAERELHRIAVERLVPEIMAKAGCSLERATEEAERIASAWEGMGEAGW